MSIYKGDKKILGGIYYGYENNPPAGGGSDSGSGGGGGSGTPPSIIPLEASINGTYQASDYSADTFNPVVINVDTTAAYDEGYDDGFEECIECFLPLNTSEYDTVVVQVDFRKGKNNWYGNQWIMDARILDEEGNVWNSGYRSYGNAYTPSDTTATITGLRFVNNQLIIDWTDSNGGIYYLEVPPSNGCPPLTRKNTKIEFTYYLG